MNLSDEDGGDKRESLESFYAALDGGRVIRIQRTLSHLALSLPPLTLPYDKSQPSTRHHTASPTKPHLPRFLHQSPIYCPSTFGFTNPSVSPTFSFSPKSGLGISTPSVVRPYIIPPNLLTGLSTPGSIIFLSSLIASSLTQNFTPSTTTSTPVFFPFVTRLSNS